MPAAPEPIVGGGTPAAPVPQPPAPAAKPPPTPSPEPSGDDEFAALSAAVRKADTSTPAKGDKAPEKPKPKIDINKPLPENIEKVGDWKDFRSNYEKIKADLELSNKGKADLEAKLQSQIADLEARGKDTTALTERLDNLQKDMEKIQAENRALKQETDPEFKKKWDAPFEREASRAERDMEGINILVQKTDKETGETTTEILRPATYKDDFVRLYRQPRAAALAEARRMFGEQAEIVTDHLKTLWRLDDERSAALTEERERWKQSAAEEQANRLKHQEQVKTIREKVRNDLANSVEDYRDPADDKELNEARQKGYAIFDAEPKTFQQGVLKWEHVRHRVAAYEPMRLRLIRANAEIAALKAKVEDKKDPTPGATKKPGGTAEHVDTTEDFETGLRKHLAAAGQI